MGGHAFGEDIKLARLSPEDYQKITQIVLNLLKPYVIDAKIPLHILSKKDHGDVDVLYLPDPEKIPNFKNFVSELAEKFKSQAVTTNGKFVSLHFNLNSEMLPPAQIDLIPAISTNDLNFQHFYLSHHDFGSIVGQICSNLGYTFSANNLKIKIFYKNDPSKMTGEIILSENPEKVCQFLDYDYLRLLQPFETELDFFKFMTTSQFFKVEFFDQKKDFNYTHRKRAGKRPIYTRFMQWIDQEVQNGNLSKNPNLQDETSENRAVRKQDNKIYAAKYFNKFENYTAKIEEFDKITKIKEKFNGKIVQEILPIFAKKIESNRKNGKFLGLFCEEFKKSPGYSEELLLEKSEAEIEAKILYIYSKFEVNWFGPK